MVGKNNILQNEFCQADHLLVKQLYAANGKKAIFYGLFSPSDLLSLWRIPQEYDTVVSMESREEDGSAAGEEIAILRLAPEDMSCIERFICKRSVTVCPLK